MISFKQQKIFWKYAIKEKNSSTVMLFLANLVALLGVMIFSANYTELFLAYFFQSIIISIFYFKKLKNRNKYSTRGIYFNDYSFCSRNEQIRRHKSSKLAGFVFVEFLIIILFLILTGLTGSIDTIIEGTTIGIIPLIIIYLLNHYYSYKVNKGKEFEFYQDLLSCTTLGSKRSLVITLLSLIGFFIITYINIPILLAIIILVKIYFDILMHEIEHYNFKLVESKI